MLSVRRSIPTVRSFLRTLSSSTEDIKDTVRLEIDGPFATVTLNRPQLHNAFSDLVIERCSEVFEQLHDNKDVRGVFVRAAGKSFCAGADLNWMKRSATYTYDQNKADAVKLSQMLRRLDTVPAATIALVQGAAFGGGVGLISCCDIAVGVSSAKFSLSEVRLGLIPATISPYVVARIGAPNARRFFLTAEPFAADKAKEIGLLHEVVTNEDELNEVQNKYKKLLMAAGPDGVRQSKVLIRNVTPTIDMDERIHMTATMLADQRASAEGQEGLAAFLEKRKPNWTS